MDRSGILRISSEFLVKQKPQIQTVFVVFTFSNSYISIQASNLHIKRRVR